MTPICDRTSTLIIEVGLKMETYEDILNNGPVSRKPTYI